MRHDCRANMCIPPIHCERDCDGNMIDNVSSFCHDICGEGPCKYADNPGGSLSFAGAMALDPEEVEFSIYGGAFEPLTPSENRYGLARWREAKFRRSRPKRSRVQEMAFERAGKSEFAEMLMSDAVKAVMQEVNWRVEHGASPTQIADVEKLFLEPR